MVFTAYRGEFHITTEISNRQLHHQKAPRLHQPFTVRTFLSDATVCCVTIVYLSVSRAEEVQEAARRMHGEKQDPVPTGVT